MKILSLVLMAVLNSLSFAGSAQNEGPLPPVVAGEFKKSHDAFLKTFRESEQRLVDLKKERDELVEKYKAEAAFFEEGSEALKKYDLLLVVRNTNEKGDLDERNEVAAEDVKNLNELFNRYLQSTLLPKRVCVSYARKVISRAKRDLERKASDYLDPDDSNNPELAIISQRLENATTKRALVTDFAFRIGIDIKREIASEQPSENNK